jgi:hypothetical protein
MPDLTSEALELMKLRVMRARGRERSGLPAKATVTADELDALIAAAEERDGFTSAIDRSPYDLRTCVECLRGVVTTMNDDMPCCDHCAKELDGEPDNDK